jgi:hypothetical protein
MNEVQVFFLGIAMWWLAAPGPYVIIPDLSSHQYAHDATIRVKADAFVDGQCPRGFTSSAGTCAFAINGAGAQGGVTISFLASATVPAPASSFCMLPKLQRNSKLMLRRDSTPPLGKNNAAWMMLEGGSAVAGMRTCKNGVPGNCPRFVRWSVPATSTEPVELVLGNLAGGAPPVRARVKAAAQISISNSPHLHPASHAATQPRLTDTLDWCAYFDMVERVGRGGTPTAQPCPGPPAIPRLCRPSAPEPREDETVDPTWRTAFFQTIACSNSQYP